MMDGIVIDTEGLVFFLQASARVREPSLFDNCFLR